MNEETYVLLGDLKIFFFFIKKVLTKKGSHAIIYRHWKTEVYPSPAEGIGLENRQEVNASRGFESLNLRQFFNEYRGMEQSGSSSGS